MKKIYIILGQTLRRIGGVQIYLDNKSKYLNDNGWEVVIITYASGKILISGLKQYDIHIHEELAFSPSAYSEKKQQQIINRIVEMVRNREPATYIVESLEFPTLSLWGEIIAKKLNGNHLIYNIAEILSTAAHTANNISFLNFKTDRGELATINNAVFDNILIKNKSRIIQLHANPSRKITNIKDIPTNFLDNVTPADFTIGIYSRISKPFVIPSIDAVIQFAQQHPNKIINLLLLGGGNRQEIIQKKIDNKINKQKNIKLFVTGILYPVPLNILIFPDVYIATAATAWQATRFGIPTISVDCKDCEPLGILGHTTSNSTFRDENDSKETFVYWLNKILIEKTVEKKIITPPGLNIPLDYSSHLTVIEDSKKLKLDHFAVTYKTDGLRQAIEKIMIRILGVKSTIAAIEWLKRKI